MTPAQVTKALADVGVTDSHVTRFEKGQWQINLNGPDADRAVEVWMRALEDEAYPPLFVVPAESGSASTPSRLRRMIERAAEAKRP